MSLFTDVEMQSISAFVRSKKITSSSTYLSKPSNVITFEKKLQTYVVHLMCSVLPHLLTAKRRLRLSSQYSRCKTAGYDDYRFQIKSPATGEGPRVPPVDCVSLSEERYIGKQNFFRNTFFRKICIKMLFLAARLACVTQTPIKPRF